MEIRRSYKFRLYPTKRQEEALQKTLSLCCTVYNACLQERREAYQYYQAYFGTPTGMVTEFLEKPVKDEKTGEMTSIVQTVVHNTGQKYRPRSKDGSDKFPFVARIDHETGLPQPELPTKNSQSKAMFAIRNETPEFMGVYAQVLITSVMDRLDKAFENFYRRAKQPGVKAGYPRYKPFKRYDSFIYPQGQTKETEKPSGWSLTKDRLKLSMVGGERSINVRIKLHRKFSGLFKTLTIKREGVRWYACFSVIFEKPEVKPVDFHVNPIGVDMGLDKFLTQSNEFVIPNQRHLRKSADLLTKHQQSLSTKKKGSNRRKKQVRILAGTHRYISNQRKDFAHRQSHKMVKRFSGFVFEDLQIANMVKKPKAKENTEGTFLPNGASAKAGLNKSILDAGWGQFYQFVSYKAEEAGKKCFQVNPQYTSMVCSVCGVQADVKAPLDGDRLFRCVSGCGMVLDRDINAARNILQRGFVSLFEAEAEQNQKENGVFNAIIGEMPVRSGKSKAKSSKKTKLAEEPQVRAPDRPLDICVGGAGGINLPPLVAQAVAIEVSPRTRPKRQPEPVLL